MASRYWIGGSGNWTDTAHWSESSGGAGGASVPTSSDDVFINASSGFSSGGSISFSTDINMKSLTCTSGHTYTIGSERYRNVNVGGDITLEAGVTFYSVVGGGISLCQIPVSGTLNSFSQNGATVYSYFASTNSFPDRATVTLRTNLYVSNHLNISDVTFDANGYDVNFAHTQMNDSSFGLVLYMGSGTWTSRQGRFEINTNHIGSFVHSQDSTLVLQGFWEYSCNYTMNEVHLEASQEEQGSYIMNLIADTVRIIDAYGTGSLEIVAEQPFRVEANNLYIDTNPTNVMKMKSTFVPGGTFDVNITTPGERYALNSTVVVVTPDYSAGGAFTVTGVDGSGGITSLAISDLPIGLPSPVENDYVIILDISGDDEDSGFGADGIAYNVTEGSLEPMKFIVPSGLVSTDYVELEAVSGDGGARFYAGDNSIDSGGNYGWIFTSPPLEKELEPNNMGSSVAISALTISRTIGLSLANMASSTAISTTTVQKIVSLALANLASTTSMASPDFIVTRGLLMANIALSTAMTSPLLNKTTPLSADDMDILTTVYGIDISGGAELIVDNHSIVVGMSNPTNIVIRNLETGQLFVGTKADGLTLSRIGQMSINNLLTSIAFENLDVERLAGLQIQNQTVSTSTSGVTLGVVRNLVTGNLVVLVAENSLSLEKLINLQPTNLSLVTSVSGVSLTSEMLLQIASHLVAVKSDSPTMTSLRSMGVEPLSVLTELSSTLAQIGYPVFGIGSDEIYSLGTIPEGEYNIATLNNNEIYEVVEQDGI